MPCLAAEFNLCREWFLFVDDVQLVLPKAHRKEYLPAWDGVDAYSVQQFIIQHHSNGTHKHQCITIKLATCLLEESV